MGKKAKTKIRMNPSSVLLLNINTDQYEFCIQQFKRDSPQGIKGSIHGLATTARSRCAQYHSAMYTMMLIVYCVY